MSGLYSSLVRIPPLLSDDEAAAYIAAQQLADPTTKVFVWFIGNSGDAENWTFRWATVGGYVAGVTDITEQLYWAGPLAIDEGGAGGEVTATSTPSNLANGL